MRTSAKVPYGTKGQKWLARHGLKTLEESTIISLDSNPEFLQEYKAHHDAYDYLYDRMRETRFTVVTSLFSVMLLAETLYIEKRIYEENDCYSIEEISDVYCPIPPRFNRSRMLFEVDEDKENVSDDNDDGRNDDFD